MSPIWGEGVKKSHNSGNVIYGIPQRRERIIRKKSPPAADARARARRFSSTRNEGALIGRSVAVGRGRSVGRPRRLHVDRRCTVKLGSEPEK